MATLNRSIEQLEPTACCRQRIYSAGERYPFYTLFSRPFEAYTAALNEAFVDLIVENPKLIQLLGETFDDAVSVYR